MEDQETHPAPNTPLVGRAADTDAVARMLGDSARLVTLTGPPGAGKTRLARAIADRLAAQTADGIAFVPLATVRDAELVAPAIGQVLGVVETAGHSTIATLAHYLRNKRTLLLLDHIVPAGAPVVAALLATPNVTILATSRTPLGIPGEHVYPVLPLPLPDVDATPSADNLMGYGSTRLFVERARITDPDFALAGDDDARAVAAICRLLAGLPLAIELVAARCSDVTLPECHATLKAQLPPPPSGPKDSAAYDRTLRATIAWSDSLLPEPQQRLLARLALFVGGCTQEAARAVCNTGDLGMEIEDGLHALNALQLVARAADGDGEVRYLMLEPIRAYAAARLAATDEEAAIWRRLVAYYVTLASQTELMLRGPQQVSWLNRLEAELGNLRAALRWAFDRGDTALGLRLAGGLDRFWQYHPHVAEGRQWLARGLAIGTAAPPLVRAKALSIAGWLARFQDDMEQSEALLAEALAVYRGLDDRRGIAEVMDTLGDLAHFRGDQERARALHQQNLALRRELGDRWGVAMTLNSLGWIALAEGDLPRAGASLQESLALVRQLGDGRGIAMVLTGLGWLSLDRDDARQAQVCLRESLALFRDLGAKIDVCLCLEGLGAVAGMRHEGERAARLFGAASAIREAMNIDYAPITERHYARHRETARSQIDADAWAAAWEAGLALPLDQAIGEALGVGATDDRATPRME